MKKLIIFIASIFCLWLSASAQKNYYYSDGRIPLIVDKTQIVAIASKSEDINLLPSQGFSFVKNISDRRSKIQIYEMASYATIKRAIAANPSDTMSILPCYKTTNGMSLIPTGYINVELKSAEDYPILESVAEKLGCEIIEQNQFMPLWYNLRVRQAPGRNPVDIANTIYETGKFSSSSPDFSFNAYE